MLIILVRLPNFSTGGFPEKSRLPNCLLNNLFTPRFVIVNLRRKIRSHEKRILKRVSYCLRFLYPLFVSLYYHTVWTSIIYKTDLKSSVYMGIY